MINFKPKQTKPLQFEHPTMPRAQSEAPMSVYDYDQERMRSESKTPEFEDRQVAANMKALRLLDQSQVRSTMEATRNHNSNMNALKLLDQVAGGENYANPKPTIMPGMDLSPKQYSGNEEAREAEDVTAMVDNFKRYKSTEAVAHEQDATFKALKLVDEVVGGVSAGGSPPHSPASSSNQSDVVQPLDQSPKQYSGEEDAADQESGENVKKYKRSSLIAREKAANYKALKLMDQKFGGAANAKGAKSSPFVAGGTSTRASVSQKSTKQVKPKRQSDVVQPLDQSPKQYSGDEDSDDKDTEESVNKYKRSDLIAREKAANYKALKLMDKKFAGAAKGKGAKSSAHSTGGISRRTEAAKKNEMETRSKKKPEEMATTTRRKKLPNDNVPKSETMAGMKNDLDFKKEKEAENKALQLVNSSYIQGTQIV